MIGIRSLEIFETLAEELNFGRAAERLNLAQSALSRHIQRLERDVGATLLKRSQRSVELTPAGRIYLERIKRVLDELERAAVIARRVSAGEYGRLVVGFIHSSTFGLMPRLARQFSQLHPDVELELREMKISEQIEALRSDVIDVGLMRNPVDNPELLTRVVLEEVFLLAVPSDHPLAGAEKIALEQVKHDPFILFSIENNPLFHARMLFVCEQRGFLPKPARYVTHLHTLLGWVGAGMGVALVPEAARHLRIAGVQLLNIEDTPLRSEVILAWRRKNPSAVIPSFLKAAEIVAREMNGTRPI